MWRAGSISIAFESICFCTFNINTINLWTKKNFNFDNLTVYLTLNLSIFPYQVISHLWISPYPIADDRHVTCKIHKYILFWHKILTTSKVHTLVSYKFKQVLPKMHRQAVNVEKNMFLISFDQILMAWGNKPLCRVTPGGICQ